MESNAKVWDYEWLRVVDFGGLGVCVTRVGKAFGFRTGVVLLPAAQVSLNTESRSLNPQILALKSRCG